jgi:hypothetical protein
MKKHLFSAIFCLLATSMYARDRYCELTVYQPNFKRYVAKVNYSDVPKTKFDPITDNSGKKLRFESKLEALNYMQQDGWQLVSVYYTRGNEAHFFLKK